MPNRYFLLISFCAVLLLQACSNVSPEAEEHNPSHAGASLNWWAMARTFPDGRFHTEKYTEAMAAMRLAAELRDDRNPTWEALGPKNIGGRTLCLAVNPADTNIIWAGSASGGLWKSTTGGRGVNAWTRVETGFPVLGVAAIAINPANPNDMYIGTGEVYNWENSMPNVVIRTTRGTYGIGILKSTDGGVTWAPSLDWAYGDLRGVQDIKINPKRPATVFAATTEGVYRSQNAGASWQVVNQRKMAVDIEINPVDTTKIYVTHGSLNDDDVSGIYRSTNGGNSFTKLTNGLPATYSGKTLLGMSPSDPNYIYASVGNDFDQVGLYRTNNGGDSWDLVNTTDVCTYQGWYSHDIAVSPGDTAQFLWAGLNMWKSYDGGFSVNQKTYWNYWYFGAVPVGGPEGPFNYVHADIHRVYWLPNDPNKVYAVTDGGIFISYNGGESWNGRNGGYQTQQFYANFSNSATNPNVAIGGMQDNATAIFKGSPAWTRVLGGDGACTAISPADDQRMYGSSQYMNVSRTTNGGTNWSGINGGAMSSEEASFNGPFELAPSNPTILYAGAQSVYKLTNNGSNITNYSNGFVSGGDLIITVAVDPANAATVYCSTAPTTTNEARVFKITGPGAVTQLTGLPNRMCMDIAIDPINTNTVYAAFAGFNTQHVWKSVDGGTTWAAIDQDLPDIPANSLLVDPLYPNHVYLGTDLGVWLSRDGGNSWELFSADAPNAMLAMNLSISSDRRLRVATHGLGVWQTALAEAVSVAEAGAAPVIQLRPNPAVAWVDGVVELTSAGDVLCTATDMSGKSIYARSFGRQPAGNFRWRVDVADWPAGYYGLKIQVQGTDGKRQSSGKVFEVAR